MKLTRVGMSSGPFVSPRRPKKVFKALKLFLHRRGGFKSVQEAVGAHHKNVEKS